MNQEDNMGYEETVVADDSEGFTESAEGTVTGVDEGVDEGSRVVEYNPVTGELGVSYEDDANHSLARLEEQAAKHRQALQAKEVEIQNLRMVRAAQLREEAEELERRAAEMRDQADEYDPPSAAVLPNLDDVPIQYVPVDSGTMAVTESKPRKRKVTKKAKAESKPRAKKAVATGPKPEAKAVLKQLRQNPEVSAADLARVAGWDKNATLAVLKVLEADGKVAREGIKNGTKWSVA